MWGFNPRQKGEACSEAFLGTWEPLEVGRCAGEQQRFTAHVMEEKITPPPPLTAELGLVGGRCIHLCRQPMYLDMHSFMWIKILQVKFISTGPKA